MFATNILLTLTAFIRTYAKIDKQSSSHNAHGQYNPDQLKRTNRFRKFLYGFILLFTIYATTWNRLLLQRFISSSWESVISVLFSIIVEVLTVFVTILLHGNLSQRRMFGKKVFDQSKKLFILCIFFNDYMIYF